MKLTPWFPGDVKPFRKGVYERVWLEGEPTGYSYWNGKFWGALSPTPSNARQDRYMVSDWQILRWRGVEK